MVLKVFCRTMSADNRVCAERFIRPLAGERKNSLFFGSDKMAGLKGGIWKLYNDIPSMIGYLFTLLIIYKLHIKLINGLFVLTNKISYEWYLVHMLVFSCTFYYLYKLETFGMVAIAVISFIFSYVVACLYHWILSKMKIF